MSTAAYPLAAIPEPYRILGLELKPLCLGHCVLMERFGVSFITREDRDPTLADLVLGVFICSQSYDSFLDYIQAGDWQGRVTEWGRHCKQFDIPGKIALFTQYLRDGSEEPVVIFEPGNGQSGAHWTQCLKIALIQIGYSPAEALNMPLTQAKADFYKIAENQGVLRIASPEEAAAMLALSEEEVPVGR